MRTTRLPAVDWTDAPRRFKWIRPFRRKTKSGFCACANTLQTHSTSDRNLCLLSTYIIKLLHFTNTLLAILRPDQPQIIDTHSYNDGSHLWGTYSASVPWGSAYPPPQSCGEVKTVSHTASSWDSRSAPRRVIYINRQWPWTKVPCKYTTLSCWRLN